MQVAICWGSPTCPTTLRPPATAGHWCQVHLCQVHLRWVGHYDAWGSTRRNEEACPSFYQSSSDQPVGASTKPLFLLGCPNLTIITDHYPLVKLLGDRALKEMTNLRLFCSKEKSLNFRFTVKYFSGKQNSAADSILLPSAENTADLSTSYCWPWCWLATDSSRRTRKCPTSCEGPGLCSWWLTRMTKIVCVSSSQTVYNNGWRQAYMLPTRDWTSCCRGPSQGWTKICNTTRPRALHVRPKHHRSHQRLSFAPLPEYPFQMMVVDMFQQEGHTYIAYADRFTRWLEVAHFHDGTTSQRIKKQIRCYFTWWNTPEQITTNGGVNLISGGLTSFFRKWGVAVPSD